VWEAIFVRTKGIIWSLTPLAGLEIRLEFFLERFASTLSERRRRGIFVAPFFG
jgi:hypothetical protein